MAKKDLPEKESELGSRRKLEQKVFDILIALGIRTHLKGFEYLCEAVCIVYRNAQAGESVVGGLYARMALGNRTTRAGIERSMRTALYKLAPIVGTNIYRYYFNDERHLTVKKFINALADKLREESEKEAESEDLSAG